MLKKGDIVDLEISNLAFGGQGVGRISFEETSDGKLQKPLVVFVNDVVPGDKVAVKITFLRKNRAEGFVEKFYQKSALRIAPRCKHFGKVETAEFEKDPAPFENKQKNCGGCSWQFLSYENQLEYKTQQVRESLERLGGLDGSVVLPAIGMAEPWYYRNKMEFSFSYEKNSQKLSLGLHMKGRHHDVTEIEECFLMKPFIGPFVKATREFFQQKIIAEKFFENNIILKSLTVRQGVNTGEILINLSAENGKANFLDEFKEFVLDFFAEFKPEKEGKLVSIYFTHIFNQKGYRKSQQEHLLWGEKSFREKLRLNSGKELEFQVAPEAFFQPNTKQAEIVYELVVKAAELTGQEIVYDLFCGTGTIGIFCAEQASKVIGLEMNESAVLNAKKNAEINQVENIEFVVGDVNKLLPTLQQKPDVVIVDPPRAGLQPEVIETILKTAAKKVVYVSCNPTALARDLRLFQDGGFKIEFVQPVDQFCQTYHIESVVKLVRAK